MMTKINAVFGIGKPGIGVTKFMQALSELCDLKFNQKGSVVHYQLEEIIAWASKFNGALSKRIRDLQHVGDVLHLPSDIIDESMERFSAQLPSTHRSLKVLVSEKIPMIPPLIGTLDQFEKWTVIHLASSKETIDPLMQRVLGTLGRHVFTLDRDLGMKDRLRLTLDHFKAMNEQSPFTPKMLAQAEARFRADDFPVNKEIKLIETSPAKKAPHWSTLIPTETPPRRYPQSPRSYFVPPVRQLVSAP